MSNFHGYTDDMDMMDNKQEKYKEKSKVKKIELEVQQQSDMTQVCQLVGDAA